MRYMFFNIVGLNTGITCMYFLQKNLKLCGYSFFIKLSCSGFIKIISKLVMDDIKSLKEFLV